MATGVGDGVVCRRCAFLVGLTTALTGLRGGLLVGSLVPCPPCLAARLASVRPPSPSSSFGLLIDPSFRRLVN